LDTLQEIFRFAEYDREAMRILVVEDERRMAKLLKQGLAEEGHAVTLAFDGKEGIAVARSNPFDLIILDVMLPGLDGFTVARRLRAGANRTPVLMLTARDSTGDIVAGLDAGADDYLTKPFSFDELFARVRAVARRGPVARPVRLQIGDVTLDPSTHEVSRAGCTITLTRTEFGILELLMRNAGQVVARDTLIEGVWGVGADIENNTLDAFIRLLRIKLEQAGGRSVIQTVRGVGYTVKQEE
jgi:DNA-binding response OmpR family regulator